MDNIFSRKRFKIPTFIISKKKKARKLAIIIAVGLFVAAIIIHEFNPVFDKLCKEKARAISTEIINIEASKIFTQIEYEDLVNIEKDDNRQY